MGLRGCLVCLVVWCLIGLFRIRWWFGCLLVYDSFDLCLIITVVDWLFELVLFLFEFECVVEFVFVNLFELCMVWMLGWGFVDFC